MVRQPSGKACDLLAQFGLIHLCDILKTNRWQVAILSGVSFINWCGLYVGLCVFEDGLQLVSLIWET